MDVPDVKIAVTDYDIDELLRSRWSPRALADRPIGRDEMLRLLEAARWAPSCANEQPWRFVVGRRGDGDAFERLLACLVEGNRRWAVRAGLLVLSVAKLTFEKNGAPNRHAQHDVGLALAHLLLQATSMGLASHPMAGFDVEAARTTCGVPDGFEPMTMTAFGYPGDPGELAESLRARELAARERLPVASLAFSGVWGSPL